MEGALPSLCQLTDVSNPDVSTHYAQLHTFNNTATHCHFTATVTTSSHYVLSVSLLQCFDAVGWMAGRASGL